MNDSEKNIKTAALLLLAGGIVGAAAALLYAPQSGQRTRYKLNRYAKKIRREAGESVEDLKENINDMVDVIGDRTDTLLEQGKNIAGSARKDLIRLIEEGSAKLEQFRTKLSRM